MTTFRPLRAKSARSNSTKVARRAPDTLTVSSEGDVEDDEPQGMQRHEGAPQLDFATLMRMGDELARTGFLPQHIRTGGQAAAIIMTGRELGMEPMRALRSLQMVKGRVIEDANSQLSRFKRDGGRSSFKHLLGCEMGAACKGPVDARTGETLHLDEEHACLWLRHPNGDEHVEQLTMAKAKARGLAVGETYRKFPEAMLRSRCITAGLKSLGWEGGTGVYSPDEAVHFDEPAPTPAAPPQRRQRAPREESGKSAPAPAPPANARAMVVRCMNATDAAGDDDEKLARIEEHWLRVSAELIDDREWRIGVEAYVAMARAAAQLLTYEPSHVEVLALTKIRALRDGTAAAHAQVPAGDTGASEAEALEGEVMP